MKQEALNRVKLLLGIKDEGKDDILSIIICEVQNLILGYCHLDIMPRQLESFVPVMAADYYRRKGYGTEAAPEHIKSITQGKRSVSMESEAFNTDAFLNEYARRLRPYVRHKGRVPSDIG